MSSTAATAGYRLHPHARLLYRRIIDVGREHPTMTLDEVRAYARVEFYRRGTSTNPEMIARALAYGRKQLRHMKNAVNTYNVSVGGALDADWTRLNKEAAARALTSPDGRVRYIPRRNVVTNYRETVPAFARTPRQTSIDNEKRGLLAPSAREEEFRRMLAATTAATQLAPPPVKEDQTPRLVDRASFRLRKDQSVIGEVGVKHGSRSYLEIESFQPLNDDPFTAERGLDTRRRTEEEAVLDSVDEKLLASFREDR
eukprot:Rhum_TRINITY_DN5639_c0_g1::Rhum_TRINITY_DN5639_c0_g1_i1::g.17934::m.17934